ncbi:polymorphic toxin-type HINT domain-containing protein [Gimesia maris]|uniref:Intein C-terminal splicing domain-containing protein n=1 Tax=Gimesia maris TaxID=122 RepID=A0ABX5YK87_9PLAN|nr:polymorphic toxin-type HINT domain-containing protein [Gimesia maris]QEG16136.1 hypothetical protein GmarT_19970 [Gimesia maris]
MSDLTRKLAIFSCFLFTGFCFWKAGAGLIGDADAEILPSAHAAMSPSISPPRVVTTPIQQMRPGMRVVGRNPLRRETEATIDPTPESWRLVSVQMRKEDGTYFEAELLRPLSWIYRHRAQPGAVNMLNMPELHVVGAAEVISISACPPIDAGDGPVVISTFKNTADNVLNIYVEGEAEPIGVTAGHPIWSEDRQAFIHSDQLQPGERLRSAVGRTVRITSIEIRAGPEPVYNLEVAGEHVYSVTDSGLLVHNTVLCGAGLTQANLSSGSALPANHTLNSTERLLKTSEGRLGLLNSKGVQYLGHAGDHIPAQGANKAVVVAHSRSRPNKANTTVYRNRKHAVQDLRDALNGYSDEVSTLLPGQVLRLNTKTSTIRQG